jgi:hypothetical protein
MKILVPYIILKLLSNWATGGFSRRTQLHKSQFLNKRDKMSNK